MDNPKLRGKPLLVGGLPEQRGVVAACSYEARAFGIRSAMPMRTALNRCPEAIVVQPRFDRYREVSKKVMDIFRSLTDLVEPLSLDEAFLDVTDLVEAGTAVAEVAQTLKARIREEVGLTISVGAAISKSVAKIASDLNKPDGLVVVKPGAEMEFLAPLPVRKLGGIGPKTEQRLREKGVETLADLAGRSDHWLRKEFGKRGMEIAALSRGQDNSPVTTERIAKSLSAETTFPKDVEDPKALAEAASILSERVGRRLRRAGAMGRTVTLKLRLSDFTTLTRSTTLAAAVDDGAAIQEVCQRLLEKELAPERRFRLLGVGVSGFVTLAQLPLFDTEQVSTSPNR